MQEVKETRKWFLVCRSCKNHQGVFAMTEQLYVESINKIIQNKKMLESSFKIKLSNKSHILFIEGKAEDEFLALQAVEALNLGFSINEVVLLKNEEFVFEKIYIKNITKRRNMSEVRGRVIGAGGKALRVLEELSGTYIAVHDNTVGVIGELASAKKAVYALKRIIAGSKHSAMYAYLEKQKVIEKSTKF